MSSATLIACHDCDLIQRLPELQESGTVRCIRCNAVLCEKKRDTIDRTLALAVAGMVLFAIANTYPFLAFKIQTQIRETTLLTGIQELFALGMPEVAILVLLTTVLVPLIQMICLLHILVPIKFGRISRYLPQIFRLVRAMQPWNMVEVFMLGILVSAVKLLKMAKIIPGIALYSFLALIFVLAAITASLDAHQIWEKWDNSR